MIVHLKRKRADDRRVKRRGRELTQAGGHRGIVNKEGKSMFGEGGKGVIPCGGGGAVAGECMNKKGYTFWKKQCVAL